MTTPQVASVPTSLSKREAKALDLGLLVIRLSTGLFLASHGAQKLFGVFGGPGLAATARGFSQIGYRPGTLFALLSGLCEFGGGLGVAFGVITPLAAAAVLGNMINATAVVWPNGFEATNGGYEYPLLIGLVAAGLALSGPGQYSVDAVIGLERTVLRPGLRTGVAAILLAIVTATITLIVKG